MHTTRVQNIPADGSAASKVWPVSDPDCVVSLTGNRKKKAGLLCKSLSVSGVEKDEMDGSEQRLDVQTSGG